MVLERKNLVVKYEHLHPEVQKAVDFLLRMRRIRTWKTRQVAAAVGILVAYSFPESGVVWPLLATGTAGTLLHKIPAPFFHRLSRDISVLVRNGKVFKESKRFPRLAKNLPEKYKYFFVNGDGHLVFTNKNPLVGRKRELTR